MTLRTLHDLSQVDRPAWPVLAEWFAESPDRVTVLPPDASRRGEALVQTQLSAELPLGAILLETGGLLVDHGWLRVLGGGSPAMSRTLPEWNLRRTYKSPGDQPPFLLIADDVVGGFFAMDGGAFKLAPGEVAYFAPDTGKWEPTGLDYPAFLGWCIDGNLEKFYEAYRWPTWREDIAMLKTDQAIAFGPPALEPGSPIHTRSRSVVPLASLYAAHVNFFAR